MNQRTNPLTLSVEEIEERLDEHVDAVLSSRRTAAEPARRLAELGHGQQDFVLQWVAAMAQTNAEMAYQFAAHASKALRHMDTEGVEAWAIQAMDAYDKKGLSAGIAQLNKIREFVTQRQERATGLAFDEVTRVLENYIHGLNGRMLNLDTGDDIYTDTLFLPGLINRLATREANFRLYKAMAVYQWAQTWHGCRMSLPTSFSSTINRRKLRNANPWCSCARAWRRWETAMPSMASPE
jgi:nitric oxide reductase NorD protein